MVLKFTLLSTKILLSALILIQLSISFCCTLPPSLPTPFCCASNVKIHVQASCYLIHVHVHACCLPAMAAVAILHHQLIELVVLIETTAHPLPFSLFSFVALSPPLSAAHVPQSFTHWYDRPGSWGWLLSVCGMAHGAHSGRTGAVLWQYGYTLKVGAWLLCGG